MWQYIAAYIIIIGLMFVAVHHTIILWQNKTLKAFIQQQQQEASIPIYFITVCNQTVDYMYKLAALTLGAHQRAKIRVTETYDQGGICRTSFENGNELVLIDYSQDIDWKMIRDILQTPDKEIKIFFDYKLPVGAERAVIENLDLFDKAITFGYCTEKGVN